MFVFDWDTAAILIRNIRPFEASAGIKEREDWATIYEAGEIKRIVQSQLASSYKKPVLRLDTEEVPCYIDTRRRKDCEWTATTVWPKSAIQILRRGR